MAALQGVALAPEGVLLFNPGATTTHRLLQPALLSRFKLPELRRRVGSRRSC